VRSIEKDRQKIVKRTIGRCRRRASRESSLPAFEVAQLLLFLDELVSPGLTRPLQAAIKDELNHLVQFAAIQKRPVTLADVQNRAREQGEIHAVHQLSAFETRPIPDPLGPDSVPGGRLGLIRVEHGCLAFPVGAQALERNSFDPCAIALAALQQIDCADLHPAHRGPAGRASDLGRLGCFCPAARDAAMRTERGAGEEHAEALRTGNRRQARPAVVAACGLGGGRRAAVRAAQRADGAAGHFHRGLVEWSAARTANMGLNDFIKGELVEIIEWTDNSRDTLTYRFPDQNKAIKNGAQLIVRESQRAQFVYLGQFGDTFLPGTHTLTTDNIPVLTKLASWKYGFESPFKADVYFLNARLFTGNKWGTTHPIMMHDDVLGVVRVRAFGTYDFKIANPRRFLSEVAGTGRDFTLDQFDGTMQSRVVRRFADAVASAKLPLPDVAGRYREVGEALLPVLNAAVSVKYGLEVSSFLIESVSVPPEVEEAIDKRGSMTSIGNMNDYVKFQIAQGMEKGHSTGGMATELAVGLSVAQQVLQQQGGLGAVVSGGIPELLSPADAARALGVSESDVMTIVESGELAAKKIGSSYRITRSALQKYLGT
jgi:excisionase family DNA binding protein